MNDLYPAWPWPQRDRRQFLAVCRVREVDRERYQVKCENVLTGAVTNWCRIGTSDAGASAGTVLDLARGVEVLVAFPTGNPTEPGIVIARLFGQDRPPEVAEGERLVKHASGAEVRITRDGAVTVRGARDVTVESSGGAVKVSGGTVELNGASRVLVTGEELQAILSAFLAAGVTVTGAADPVTHVVTGVGTFNGALDISAAKSVTVKTGG